MTGHPRPLQRNMTRTPVRMEPTVEPVLCFHKAPYQHRQAVRTQAAGAPQERTL